MDINFSNSARRLAYAGLAPQLLFVIMIWGRGENAYVGLSMAYAYAAFIFSFLGGVWWGMALQTDRAPAWIYAAAVAPSLIAVLTYLPWVLGLSWPEPSLMALGIAIMASPLIDRAIGSLPAGWLRLRWHLSLALGALTIIAAQL